MEDSLLQQFVTNEAGRLMGRFAVLEYWCGRLLKESDIDPTEIEDILGKFESGEVDFGFAINTPLDADIAQNPYGHKLMREGAALAVLGIREAIRKGERNTK